MTTKTVQLRFDIAGTLTDVTSAVLRDATNTFGVRRTDTNVVIVASGTAMTHLSTGLYAYTFTEPEAGLNYEYVIEFIYLGITKRVRGVLETTVSQIPVQPSLTYQRLGVQTVACGDASLQTFLNTQADVVWAMQARRGVTTDLIYQYYVSDLLVYAMDYTRMQIDTELGTGAMNDRATMDASNTSSANSSTSKTRTSSFTESSSSSQNWARNAARSSSSLATLDSSNSSSRNSSSYDYSTMTQSASGSSARTQNGSSTTLGSLANPDTGAMDGTSGVATSRAVTSTISVSKNFGDGFVSPDNSNPLIEPSWNEGGDSDFDAQHTSSQYQSASGNILGLVSAASMRGKGMTVHYVESQTLGRINPDLVSYDAYGAIGDYSTYNHASSQHGRSTVGSQVGAGSSSFLSNGTRTNNRAGTSTLTANSSSVGNSSSTLTSSSHQDQIRTAASSSHSESAYNSTMTATSSLHREMTGADAMTASNTADREYYSQLFDTLKQMWEDTQVIIRKLEAQMLLASRYLNEKLSVTTPQAQLIGVPALVTDQTLIQRPGIKPLFVPNLYSPWIVQ